LTEEHLKSFMATTVHQPPQIEPKEIRPRGGNGSGNFGGLNSGPQNGALPAVQEYAPPPSRTGIWVLLAAIGMMFAAFTSALIVRKGASMDWEHLELPPILYLNTLLLLVSSVTLEFARRRVAVFMGGSRTQEASIQEARAREERPVRWLYVTLILGLAFVVGQYIAWLQLRVAGFYLATNPNSSFFYVLTAVHAVHVLGGLAGLGNVMHKLNRMTLRRSTLDSFSSYWHFMGILWVYLLGLLWMKL
jgi:cytochrome c oxidase subunit III